MSENTAVALRESPQVSALAAAQEVEYELLVKKATLLAKSDIIPDAFRGKPGNVLVAQEYAHRLGCSVLAVMQNLQMIHGRPSLSSTFLIGTVNASGRFTPLRFRFEGDPGTDDWGCRAVATDIQSGEECIGPLITIGLAKAEGWYKRNGSKWQTAPELMLHYRAASWWTRIYCPELALGLHTTDEVEDMGGIPQPHRQHIAVVTQALHAADPEEATTATEEFVGSATEVDADGAELGEYSDSLL